MSKSGFIFFFMMMNSLGVVAQAAPEVFLPDHPDDVVKFNISDISDDMKTMLGYDHLAVFVANEMNEYTFSNPIQGKYIQEENYLTFKAYFPFEKGMTYIVRTKNTTSAAYSYYSFQVGKKAEVAKAKVAKIYPSARQLPENLLRFYIYFDTPMKTGEALEHIQLIDAEGNIDKYAFMVFKQELWSSDGKRLTILFDPGRIKRGVSTNMLRGAALLKNKQYSLSISDSWQDVHGQPLSEKTIKEIEIGKAYRSKIKIEEWFLHTPKANSRNALTIHFDRIMDHALIQSMIQLLDNENNPIAGYWEILNQEQQIQFIPQNKWEKGNYKIEFDTRLEDVSGNNLKNLLDYHMTEQGTKDKSQFIYFKIK